MARRRRTKTIERLVAERVRQEREARGLSQAELGRRAGVSQSAIARLEDGNRSITITTLAKLADGLGVEPGSLLSGLDVKPKPTRSEKAFFRLAAKLRDRDADQLKAVELLLAALDRVSR